MATRVLDFVDDVVVVRISFFLIEIVDFLIVQRIFNLWFRLATEEINSPQKKQNQDH